MLCSKVVAAPLVHTASFQLYSLVSVIDASRLAAVVRGRGYVASEKRMAAQESKASLSAVLTPLSASSSIIKPEIASPPLHRPRPLKQQPVNRRTVAFPSDVTAGARKRGIESGQLPVSQSPQPWQRMKKPKPLHHHISPESPLRSTSSFSVISPSRSTSSTPPPSHRPSASVSTSFPQAQLAAERRKRPAPSAPSPPPPPPALRQFAARENDSRWMAGWAE